MADVKISGLPASTVPLAGTEVLPIVQGGTTKQVSVANLTAARPVSALSLDVTGTAIINSVNFGTQSIATNGGTTTLTAASPYYTVFTGTFVQTIVLPDATTLTAGQRYSISNAGSLAVTVQTNGAATLWTLASICGVYLTCTSVATAAGVWQVDYQGTKVATGKSLTSSNTLVLAGTDGTTMTFPSTSATIARTNAANTFTGTQTVGSLIDSALTSGRVTYASTSGLLADSAGLTFDGTNLVTTGIRTGTGTGTALPNGTFVTVISIAAIGTYLVTCSAGVSAGYQGVALVSTSGSGNLLTSLSLGGGIAFQLSGTNLQFQQNSGGAQTLTYWYTKLT